MELQDGFNKTEVPEHAAIEDPEVIPRLSSAAQHGRSVGGGSRVAFESEAPSLFWIADPPMR